MVYKSSRITERVPAEATKASRVGRRRTREAVLLVSVPRTVVDGDLFAGFNEAFEVKVGLSTLAEVGVPQQFGIGAVVVSMVCHDGVLERVERHRRRRVPCQLLKLPSHRKSTNISTAPDPRIPGFITSTRIEFQVEL